MNGKSNAGHECRMPAEDEMMQWISDMFSMGPRRAGTEEDHRCEDYLAGALREMGLENVHKDPIPIRVWRAEKQQLMIGGRDGASLREAAAHYIPYTQFTPETGVEGRLMYVGRMDALMRLFESWRGRIIVADIHFPKLDVDELDRFSMGLHDPEGTMKGTSRHAVWVRMHWNLYREAARRGAAGFIGILADHYAGGQKYYAPYGFKEKDIHDKPVPGFWVDRVVGAEIRSLAKRGAGRARLMLTGTLENGVTHNVMGEIPGETDEAYIVACHHDSPFSSAVEDASGCSVVLAVAKCLSERRALRRKTVVLFTAGHFYGSIGTRTFIRRNPGGILGRTALEYHVEHIAREAVMKPDGTLDVLERADFTGAFVPFNRPIKRAMWKAVVENGLERTMLLPAHGPLGDYPPTDGGDFHEAGVPLINTISPPLYLLNQEDTLDKVATQRLAPTARAIISVLSQLDDVSLGKLRRVDYPVRAAAMDALRRIVRIRTLAMGI